MTNYARQAITLRNRRFEWGARTYIMGIVNVSPESFSGDGLADVRSAVDQARRMADEGADIIDVGGQSTRPGFDELSIEEELSRVIPAVRAVVDAVDLPVSVDAYRRPVAEAALDAGAHLLNDIHGFRYDASMAALAAKRGVPAVVMHNQRGREFHDTIGDIRAGFEATLQIARDAGLAREQLILDPGFGFGWQILQNLDMLRRLGELRDFGLPLLIGTSRKSTIGAVLGVPENERIFGTAATVAIAIANGADIVRVHDVAQMEQVAAITDQIYRPLTAYIAIGANLGDRLKTMAEALRLLAPEVTVEAVSPLYESPPQPPAPPPAYYNAAARVTTFLTPHQLLRHLKAIERRLGRTDTTHWAPRPIDLDIALFETLVVDDGPELVIPHPRMQDRAFVLQPLLDLDPDLVHPETHATLASLLQDGGLVKVAEAGWER